MRTAGKTRIWAVAMLLLVAMATAAWAGSYTDTGYYKPSAAETNYASSVNANFDRNDELAKGWVLTNWTYSYVSTTSFTVGGDKRAYFTPNRAVKAVFSGGSTAIGTIASSSYTSPNTTVVLTSAILTASLSTVEPSLALPATPIQVSPADTTPDYLANKIVAGSGITITKGNPGANENVTITNSDPTTIVAGSVSADSGNVGTGTITITKVGNTYTISLSLGSVAPGGSW